MRPFPQLFSNLYTLVVVDYVSKWIEIMASPTSNVKMVTNFLIKDIFIRFETPRKLLVMRELILVRI